MSLEAPEVKIVDTIECPVTAVMELRHPRVWSNFENKVDRMSVLRLQDTT